MTILLQRKNFHREERVTVDCIVDIARLDSTNTGRVERTRIEDVTSVGCRFTMHEEVRAGEIVSIKPLLPGSKSLEGEGEQLFEVMWSAQSGTRWTAGAKKVEGEKLAELKTFYANRSARVRPK
jgi:hypothetical protein